MLKGGYKAIDFSEDNIFLLFNLRFRGYETHHKTPLLIYLWIKTVLKKNNQNRNLGFKSNLGVYKTQFGSRSGVLVFLVFIPQWKVKIILLTCPSVRFLFCIFFSIDSDSLNIDKKNLKLICTCLGLSQGC